MELVFQPGMIELGVVSIGTAKKVLREVRRWNPRLRTTRSQVGVPQYHSDVRDMKLNRNMVDVPRKFPEWVDIPGKLADPVAISLHEHGHAADPRMKPLSTGLLKRTKTIEHASVADQEKFGKLFIRVSLRREKRANKIILNKISKHGTPQETEAWRQLANKQMDKLYRRPLGNALMAQADTLSQGKDFLRTHPSLRKKNVMLGQRLYDAVIMLEAQEEKAGGSRIWNSIKWGVGGTAAGAGAGAVTGVLARKKFTQWAAEHAAEHGRKVSPMGLAIGAGALIGSHVGHTYGFFKPKGAQPSGAQQMSLGERLYHSVILLEAYGRP